MAGKVYSQLLAVGGTGASGTRSVYRCPSSTTAIVKTIMIYNDAAGVRTFYLDMPLGPDSTWAAMFIEVPGKNSTLVDTWIVIPAGWPLGLGVLTAGNWFWWISGSELEGVPIHPPQSTGGLILLPAEETSPESAD